VQRRGEGDEIGFVVYTEQSAGHRVSSWVAGQ
jgi:hypothetical protein